MKFRPEAEIWPLLSDAELKALAADIEVNGQQYPISLYEKDILDGRNRWLAITKFCKKAKPKFERVEPDSPIQFVVSRNEKRRHQNESQRAHTSAAALPFYEAEAQKRQIATAQKSRNKSAKGGPIGPPLKHRARDDVAKDFGTSPRHVQRGKFVRAKGSKALNEAVAAGRLTLGKAEEIVKKYPDKRKQDAQVAKIAASKMATRVKGLTGEFEWYTPREYLDAAVKVMGAIDLDPASSPAAQKHVNAKRFFTIETDGLQQEWQGRVWLNPPYAMPYIRQFAAKIVGSYESGAMSEGILLTNNATDTEWFHRALAACSALCLTRGRISFLEASNGELTEKSAPTHGQAFFYFGPNASQFAAVFGAYGSVVCRFGILAMQKVAA